MLFASAFYKRNFYLVQAYTHERSCLHDIFVEYGQIDVKDDVFVVIDKNGVRTHIPVGSVRVTHHSLENPEQLVPFWN